MRAPIALGETSGGYVVPPSLEKQWVRLSSQGQQVPSGFKLRRVPVARTTLAALAGSPRQYYTSAIWSISQQIEKYLNSRGLIGVFIQPAPGQIQETAAGGQDLRGANTALNLVIYTGRVRALRTIASGKRVPAEQRVNNPIHAWIKDKSPVQAATNDVLRRDLLDDYLFLLNRQPGRHVDVAVSAFSADEPGSVVLDYLVTETKPWTIYSQVSNTGTKETDTWRERFGFVDYQLSNRDDTLSVDYNTAGFQQSHDVAVSYDMPLSLPARQRVRVFGNYDQFTASDVGFGQERFSGDQTMFGAELSVNVYQYRDFFLDLVGGGRYEHDDVSNRTAGINQSGSADFALPYLGLRAERNTDVSTLLSDAMVVGRITGEGQSGLNTLGRLSTDSQSVLLQGDAATSFFLEPLIDPKAFENAQTTLANELYFSVRAQYAFDYRVIPTAEEVAGGMFSVRGYPESISAGDTVVVGTAEYRFHLPRTLKIATANPNFQPFGQPFKFVPQQVYGRPDWDLIFRAFVDAGRTINNQRLPFERNDTLVGTGIGAEFDLQQNFMLRVDWGVALQSIPGQVRAGSNRIHISATLLF